MDKDEIRELIESWENFRPEFCDSERFTEVFNKFMKSYQPERSKREDANIITYPMPEEVRKYL